MYNLPIGPTLDEPACDFRSAISQQSTPRLDLTKRSHEKEAPVPRKSYTPTMSSLQAKNLQAGTDRGRSLPEVAVADCQLAHDHLSSSSGSNNQVESASRLQVPEGATIDISRQSKQLPSDGRRPSFRLTDGSLPPTNSMDRFQRSMYSDSFLRQRSHLFFWYTFMTMAVLPNAVMKGFSVFSSTGVRKAFEILQFVIWATTFLLYFRLRRSLKHLTLSLCLMQMIHLTEGVVRSKKIVAASLPDESLSPEELEIREAAADGSYLFTTYLIFIPVFLNTIMILLSLQKRSHKLVCGVVTIMVVFLIVLWDVDYHVYLVKDSLGQVAFGLSFVAAMCLVFTRVFERIEAEKLAFMLEQNQENNQFRRIIDSVDDVMVIIKDRFIEFQNSSASKLFSTSTESLLATKQFYPFHCTSAKAHRSTSSEDIALGFSLEDLIERRVALPKHQLFTRHKEFGVCDPLAQNSLVLQKLRNRSEDQKGFDFFMIKLIRLRKEPVEEVAIQIVDFSDKILSDSLANEQHYLTHINATISHEMRNPLNSINAQLAHQARLIEKMFEAKESESQAGQESQFERLKELQLTQEITAQSARLLDFNVENIVSLPKLKRQQIQHNIQSHNLKTVANEIIWTTKWTAKQRAISVEVDFHGFPGSFEASLDKQRFQQVLLIFLTNALKFIDKEDGRVQIIISRIQGEGEAAALEDQFSRQAEVFFGGQDFQEMHSQDSINSSVFKPAKGTRLILSVLDNGIGIHPAKQAMLFNLFTHKTKESQAKGIGLGLTIASLIANAFGGETHLLSKPSAGSIFQASFEFEEAKTTSTFKEGNIDFEKVRKLPASEHRAFVQEYLNRQAKLSSERCIANFVTREQWPARQKRILIIDDEPYNCLALYTLLKSLSLKDAQSQVDFCMSGRDAIQNVLSRIGPAQNCSRRMSVYSPSQFSTSLNFQKRDEQQESLRHAQIADAVISKWRSGFHENFSALLPQISKQGMNVCDYGLILTDCSMPFMDGYECTQIIRELLRSAGVTEMPQIVAITGHYEVEFQMKAISSGMERIYPKPVSSDLVARLLLENRFQFKIPESLSQMLEQMP